MKVGVLDMLWIIRREEIETYGIPFLRSVFEQESNANSSSKWDVFWKYFLKQWIPIIESWNIVDKNGKYLDELNGTNNAVELYNCWFNGLFPTKLSLLLFVHELEKESRAQAARVHEIHTGKVHANEHLEVTIPVVNPGYVLFKSNANKLAKQAVHKNKNRKWF